MPTQSTTKGVKGGNTVKGITLLLAGCFLTIASASLVSAADQANIDWQQCKGQEIRIFVPTHPYIDAIRPLIPDFEKLTGIKVTLDEASEQEYFKKILLDLSSGKPNTDAFMAVHFVIPQYAKGGWIEPIQSYIENPKLTDKEWYDFADFPPVSLYELTFKDQLCAIPITTEQMVMFYRKDIFEASGIQVPDTMDQLYDAVKKINKPPQLAGIALRLKRGEGPDWPWNTFLSDYGGTWVDKSGEPHINSSEAVAATDMYLKLLKDAGPEGVLNYSWYEGSSDFSQGKLAVFIDANGFVGTFEDPAKSKVVGKVGYALMPASSSGKRCVGGSTAWSWALASASKKKDAAWLFIEWATSKQIAEQAGKAGWVARKSTWSSPAIKEKFPEEWLKVNLDGIANYSSLYSYPQVTNMPVLVDLISVALQEAFTGTKTVQKALDDCQAKTLAALKK
jgi:multiple sugar transport system substrate-binding protein